MSDYLLRVLGSERDDDDLERVEPEDALPKDEMPEFHFSFTEENPDVPMRRALPEVDSATYEIEGAREIWPYPPADDNEEVPDLEVLFEVTTYLGREVKITRASIANFRPDFTVVAYGKRRTGKTEGFKSLLYSVHRWYPKVFVFTGTVSDREWNSMVPEKFIINGFQPDVLHRILDKQDQRQEAMRARGVNDKNLWVLIILDDCVAQGLRYEDLLKRLFLNGRHLYVACWITSQDMKGLPPDLCTNTDMVMLFPVRSQRDKETVREKYLDFIKNDQELDELVREVQQVPYVATFADQSHPNMLPEECVYAGCWPWHGKDRPRFFAGSRSWWKGSEKQLIKYGGEELLQIPAEEWGMYPFTYRFNWG